MDEDDQKDKAIGIFMFLILAIIVAFSIYSVVKGQTPTELLSNIINPCREFSVVKSSRMAIIRIDDIQAYWLEKVSIKMIDDAKALYIPVSLGVIPKDMEGNTPIRRYLSANLCWIEVAQHGWDHQGLTQEMPEFGDADFATATSDILQGKAVLENLTGDKITTFIPPMNSISDEARRGVREAGIAIISSAGENEFDYGATAFNFMTGTLNSAETIIHDCAKRVVQTSSCVVMMHPQDYTTNNVLDPIKYQLYLDVLTMLKSNDYTFVRFKDLVEIQ